MEFLSLKKPPDSQETSIVSKKTKITVVVIIWKPIKSCGSIRTILTCFPPLSGQNTVESSLRMTLVLRFHSFYSNGETDPLFNSVSLVVLLNTIGKVQHNMLYLFYPSQP